MNEPIVETPARPPTSVLGQVSMMRRAFMASPLRNTIFGLGAGILVVILATAAGQIVGPSAVGFVADHLGGLRAGFAGSAAVLALAALVATRQRPLAPRPA